MFWKKNKEEKPKSPNEIPASASPADAESQSQPKKKGLFGKLFDRIKATSDAIVQKTVDLFRLHGKIDDDLLDELEEALISSDVGLDTTLAMIEELRNRIRREKKAESTDLDWLTRTLRDITLEMLDQGENEINTATSGPSIYLIIGVNGVGKTTAIGKLAHRFKEEGKSVMLVAGDTFRAAAIQQLEIWAERAAVPIVAGQEKADPASVVYNAMQRAKSENPDVVIIDTAGRLHTKVNLMQELSKVSRVINREFSEAPHETMLVLDASTGQNALQQAKIFMESCDISSLILTKLDGTAKGGVVISLHNQLKLPVKFIGIGEGIEDLEPFNARAFANALFQIQEEEESPDQGEEAHVASAPENENS